MNLSTLIYLADVVNSLGTILCSITSLALIACPIFYYLPSDMIKTEWDERAQAKIVHTRNKVRKVFIGFCCVIPLLVLYPSASTVYSWVAISVAKKAINGVDSKNISLIINGIMNNLKEGN